MFNVVTDKRGQPNDSLMYFLEGRRYCILSGEVFYFEPPCMSDMYARSYMYARLHRAKVYRARTPKALVLRFKIKVR